MVKKEAVENKEMGVKAAETKETKETKVMKATTNYLSYHLFCFSKQE
jgi:hypothetical protein